MPSSGKTFLICPACRNNGRMRKISAVISEGSATSRHGYRVESYRVETDLAAKLKMPEPPLPLPVSGVSGKLGCLGFLILLVLVALVTGYHFLPFSGIGRSNPVIAPIAIVVPACIVVVMLIKLMTNITARNNRARMNERERMDKELRVWHRMRDLWNDLYYCPCADVVFLGGNPANYASAGDMRGWLLAQSSLA